ncbi:hypothetical protein [Accumulibacter sp.]|jgi:hypothetical protein|uniref:Uncharacterized protein n=1 Tax=Accumulibacter regalis TaxID=522306 RepID=C7RMG9_ACCRE|nr:hypothetical protein [Accumulibacter sp.]MBN8495370.1 hypothetical protein [Accumulibacter sp.]MBO3713993.1 hypothetical protein [Accumulibacter sp.]
MSMSSFIRCLIFRLGGSWEVRLDKVKNQIVDKDLLREISLRDSDPLVLRAAQMKLRKVKADDAFARIEKCQTDTELARFARGESGEGELVQWLALRKLTDQAELGQIARLDPSAVMRWCAIKNLDDKEILSFLLDTEKTGIVRFSLAAKLKALGVVKPISGVPQISWHQNRKGGLCDTCSVDISAPEGFIGIPDDVEDTYLACDSCWDQSWTRYGYSPTEGKERAWVWWQEGGDARTLQSLKIFERLAALHCR